MDEAYSSNEGNLLYSAYWFEMLISFNTLTETYTKHLK